MEILSSILGYWWIIPILAFVFLWKFVLRLFGIVIIPDDRIGIVNKKFVLFGKNKTLPDGEIIALHGEAGIQADTLAPGIHFWNWPWQYEIRVDPFTQISEGKIGIVEARAGKPLCNGRVLAKKVESNSFQDARGFLTNGGERGPQIAIIPPGDYRINTQLFTVVAERALEIPDNKIGIVTTKDGMALTTGDIAGPEVEGHNMFQDGQAFIERGGSKGLQEQVILAGRYFINPRFATVEIMEMTLVPIANVGVVIAYIGKEGKDVTGDSFKHGNLVTKGERGVWSDPLDPGKYPINTYTHKVECVPTANVVLNWATGKTEAHKLDANLSTIKVRSSDGFTFNLDVSQIIHIPRNDAPKVIARFGSMANLVTQVLEPTIGNYFRNAAQGSDVIDFLRKRQERQNEAKSAISTALGQYNVGAVDTLIGDIVPPDDLMKTLTDRKIAEQEQVTFETQRRAQETKKQLEQATAQAATQASVVTAERQVEIAAFNAQSAIKGAEGQAQSKVINAKADSEARVINAEAEARATKVNGEAEAGKTLAIGESEAKVIKQKIESMDAGNYAVVQVAQALAKGNIKLVPDIIAGGNGTGGGLIDVLLGNLLKDSLKSGAPKVTPAAS